MSAPTLSPAAPGTPSLDDRYAASGGRALMSGVQALVRLTLEQRRLDSARGLDTAVFVSGYQGSPLGTVDLEMGRAERFLAEAGVVFRAGLNEELAATAVAGTQLLGRLPGRRHDGVTGFWYGKNPGLDRAADAIRHGQLAGTAPLGGAVAWIGDDPACKSSTVPSSCEPMCASLAMPLLAPGTIAEVVEYGLHAVALSRAAGLWVGLKIVADLADASTTVDLTAIHREVPEPEHRVVGDAPALVGPSAVEAEHDLLTRRLDLARAYARTHGLNQVTFSATRATFGIVASGTSSATVERALADLGIDAADAERLGLRLVRLGMPFPLDHGHVADLLAGLDRVLVVEDKTGFLADQLRAALYGRPDAPAVLGRHDESGAPLLSARGSLTADDVAVALARLLGADRLGPQARAHLDAQRPAAAAARRLLPVIAGRTPFFCSGCPHNRSTRTTDDTLVGVGIGCHAMIALDDGGGRGHQIGVTQMGGEGAQWLGLAPFTDDPHFVQNLGDGTFHHSGSLAVRAAVAAGVTMTYKLLYNDAVAMTGGQRAVGRVGVPELTRMLLLEGVTRVVVTTPEPETYQGVRLGPQVTVRHRDDLPAVERELAATSGVTVVVHEDRCATEERRLRKRGLLPVPAERVVVNERVCEGCGDCGRASTCMSVQPVETEFGRKTRIHQASCGSDLSCLAGDCPSFLLVEPGRTPRPRRTPDLPVTLLEPVRSGLPGAGRDGAGEVLLRMPGIGGTGVVTVSQILQMAAHLEGRHAAGLEQIGLAQKGGPVVSDVRIGAAPITAAVRASRGTVDVLVGFDLLGAAADPVLATCHPERTVAVVNTAVVPTAAMVTGRTPLPGSRDAALARIGTVTRPGGVHAVDASALADALFGDHLPVNLLLLGAVYQHGLLPVRAAAIEQAITLNGTAVATNLAAFRWGRATVQDPDAVARALGGSGAEVDDARRAETLAEVVALRVAELTGYQDARYAQRYADSVAEVAAEATRRAGPADGRRIALAHARSLHHLMAYKDEYEVARLHLDPAEQARLRAEFGPDATITVLLHPPVLRGLGIRRKIRLRRTARPVFRVLAAGRRLRGSRLDVFGLAAMRRIERALIDEYETAVRAVLSRLSPANADDVERFAALPQQIRGYEQLKLDRVAEYRAQAAVALDAFAVTAPARTG